MPDQTVGEERKETCGLCYTTSTVSKLTLPCGHSVCHFCASLDLDLQELLLTESCHICQRNGVTFDADLVQAKVKKSVSVLLRWEQEDICEVTDTIKCNLLRLYNAMKKPKDEEFLANQFCENNGGQTIMKCVRALSEKLFGAKHSAQKPAATPDVSTPVQHKLGIQGKRGKLAAQQGTRSKLAAKASSKTSEGPPAKTEEVSRESYQKLYNVLLDTLLNFTYTSMKLCKLLVDLGLLDILVERLRELEYEYRKNKALGVVVLDALGIFFNCSRTPEATNWFNPERTEVFVSYMAGDRHESAVMLLALLSLCRALPPAEISQLSVPEDLFQKITNVLDNALLDDQEQHFHSFIHFSSTSSSPELDLQELLVPISKLARHNTSYTQWVARNDLDSLLLFMRRGSDQEILLTLDIVDILAGSRCVDFLMTKPETIDGLIETLFFVYKYSIDFKSENLERKVWHIPAKVRRHYQCLLDATNHTSHTCYEQGHPTNECYFKNVLASVHRVLKTCAENNQHAKAKFLLDGFEKDVTRQILSVPLRGNTLLFIAAMKGSLDMVKYFIQDCGADIELKGIYKDPDSGMTHHAPPLWVAAVENQLDVVRYLVENGAAVNGTSDTRATPVRSACFDNNIEVVKYLVEQGADINLPNMHGGTCLMNAVRCLELVKFLIEGGAEIDSQDRHGYTALHGAIMEEETEVVKYLVNQGADIMKTSTHGDDCITTASLKGLPEVVDYLLEVAKPGPERVSQAYELLGCFYVDDKNKLEEGLVQWKRALKTRLDNDLPMPKLPKKHSVFTDLDDVMTADYIETLKGSSDKVYRQSLLIRESIVGRFHRDASYYVMYRGAVYADQHHYKESIDLWQYGLELRHLKHQDKQTPLHDDCLFTLASFSKLFCEMKEGWAPEYLTFASLFPVLEIALEEVRGVKTILRARPISEGAMKDVEIILKLLLQLVHLIIELDLKADQKKVMEDCITDLMRANYTDCSGRSLLHLAMLPSSSTIDGEPHSTFPKPCVVEIFLECGALINWLDDKRNTPFHLLLNPGTVLSALSQVPTTDIESMAKMLLEAGAHVDLKNAKGETVMDTLTKSPLNVRFSWGDHMKLKCLAAKTVKHFNLVYQDTLPKTLIPFVELH